MIRSLSLLLVLFFCSNLIIVAQEQKLEKEEVVILGKGVKLELVLIPAGKFVLGNIKIGPEVTITKPFYMGKYEVTQEQWFEIMGENPSHYKGRRLPVTNVSWKDCQDFINKLNKLEPFSNQIFDCQQRQSGSTPVGRVQLLNIGLGIK